MMLPPWQWPAIEDPADESPEPDPDGLALYRRLVREDGHPGTLALTDAQMHHFADVLTGWGHPALERARAVEAIIPRCLQPMDDEAFGDLLAAAMGRRHQAEVVPL
jgi:hypothetical protein